MIVHSMEEAPRVRVLVLDDDPMVAQSLGVKLTYVGYAVEVETAPQPVVERIGADQADWDVVLLDVEMPQISGIDVLKRFRDSGSMASVIMLTGDGSASTATACLRAGAFHYLTKPCLPIELASAVESAARHTSLRRRLAQEEPVAKATSLVGTSAAMRRLQGTVERLALQDVPVLIQGESGTGKELVAKALHDGGPAGRPFLAINCSAIPDTLIDSELFGHAKGAFTGATSDRDGVFVEADGGTLFLDEIGDMPFHVQARLLRVLQEGEIRPIGSTLVRRVRVRVLAATHVNLADAVTAGKFREDLFYRLNVVGVRVPPLRERLDDIPVLAAHFLRKHAGASAPTLTPSALDALVSDSWPGNVRELENALLHAIALHRGTEIGVEDLPPHIGARSGGHSVVLTATPVSASPPIDGDAPTNGNGVHGGLHPLHPLSVTAPMPVMGAPISISVTEVDPHVPLTEAKRRVSDAFERSYLIKLLERAHGSMSEAARLAGIDRTNLRRLLKRHQIQSAQYRRPRR